MIASLLFVPTLLASLPAVAGSAVDPVQVGSYVIEVPIAVVHDDGFLRAAPPVLPSPEAEAVAWLTRCLEGGRVRHDTFLGAERLRFDQDISALLATRDATVDATVDAMVLLVWDRDGNGRLTRRELVRGNEDLRAHVLEQAATALVPGLVVQPLRLPTDPHAFLAAWQTSLRPRGKDVRACPDCSGDPHADRLAALIGWLLDYAPEREGRRAASLESDLGTFHLEVDALPGSDSTLRIFAPDGRSFWDSGALPGSGALDGRVDAVSADEPFAGSTWDRLDRRWLQAAPDAALQADYERLVEAAHAALPERRQVIDDGRAEGFRGTQPT